jgi:putative transposase
MGIRSPLASQEIYHVYNRGTDKRDIFLDKKDYERFLALLYVCNGTKPVQLNNYKGLTLEELLISEKGEGLVDIAAYCLMENHFHLLLHQRIEGGISKFMQKLITGYTMYFNTKYKRSGVLFQGKFKSQHAGEDRYLKYLLSYIHLNPPTYATYPYSSYLDFIGVNRTQNKIINNECLPLYFPSPRKFKAELKEWLTYREERTEVEPR